MGIRSARTTYREIFPGAHSDKSARHGDCTRVVATSQSMARRREPCCIFSPSRDVHGYQDTLQRKDTAIFLSRCSRYSGCV